MFKMRAGVRSKGIGRKAPIKRQLIAKYLEIIRKVKTFLIFLELGVDNYCKGSYYNGINIARAIIERSDYY